METYDLLKIILPLLIVLYMVYLVIRSFLKKHLEEVALGIRRKNQEVVVPIRLQAYERVVLLLERITPGNLLSRLSSSKYQAEEFHQILVHEIRNELNHNLSQQVYMSHRAWTQVISSVEQVISLINSSAEGVAKDARGIELARSIIENEAGSGGSATEQAIRFIKSEIQEIF